MSVTESILISRVFAFLWLIYVLTYSIFQYRFEVVAVPREVIIYAE